MSDFAPSQVVMHMPPLVGTMGKAQIEWAAAIVIHALAVTGDTWRPIAWPEVQAVLRADLEEKRSPWCTLITNPFGQPDFHGLVDKGYARWTGEPGVSELEISEAARAAVARFVSPAPAPSAP